MLNFSMEHFKALTPPPLSNPHQIYGDEVKQGEKKIGWLTLHFLKKIGWLTLHYLKKIFSFEKIAPIQK